MSIIPSSLRIRVLSTIRRPRSGRPGSRRHLLLLLLPLLLKARLLRGEVRPRDGVGFRREGVLVQDEAQLQVREARGLAEDEPEE